MSKKLLYILLGIIAVETFLILTLAGAVAIKDEELAKVSTTTEAYKQTYTEAFKLNTDLKKQNDELWSINERVLADNKKIIDANSNLSETLRRYCP